MARKQSRIPNAVPPQMADDFRLIRGIGPVLACRLHDAGIHTYNELASMLPAKLTVRVNGLSTKQIARQDWIGQARKLASKKARPKAHKKETAMPPTHQHYENFTIEFLLDEKKEARCTRVVHVQSGDADTWAGWESGQLIDFLARHTGLHIPQAKLALQKTEVARKDTLQISNKEAERKVTRKPNLLPVLPAITKVVKPSVGAINAVLQSSATVDRTGTMCLHDLKVTLPDSNVPVFFLRQEQPYRIQLTIDHSNVTAPGDIPWTYKATIILKQLGGSCETAEEASSTLSLADSTTLSIAGNNLPTGIYRLSAFVRLMSDKAVPGLTAFLKGELLEVD